MLCTFTIESGNLIVRSDDIRAIEDVPQEKNMVGDWSLLRWIAGDTLFKIGIKGTAAENAARIQQEELDLIARIEDHRQQLQQRMQQGYPAVPVQRGRK